MMLIRPGVKVARRGEGLYKEEPLCQGVPGR
jgi:hypothetical protein